MHLGHDVQSGRGFHHFRHKSGVLVLTTDYHLMSVLWCSGLHLWSFVLGSRVVPYAVVPYAVVQVTSTRSTAFDSVLTIDVGTGSDVHRRRHGSVRPAMLYFCLLYCVAV